MEYEYDYEEYEEDIFLGDEIEKNDSEDEIYQMKIKPQISSKTPENEGFNHDAFDLKVAKSISKIHFNRKNNNFSQWVNKNHEHLQKLYILSNVNRPVEEFYTYVYKNSK